MRTVVIRLTPASKVPTPEISKRPKIVVDADAGRIGQFGERRKRQPAGARELADEQRDIDQQSARGGKPEAHGVERRKCDVADAELQRHDEVHQPDDEGHRDEEDHQRTVRGKDLVVMFGRQIPWGVEGEGLLQTHHESVGESAQQHHHREQDIHDPDAFMVHAGNPLAPKIGYPSFHGDPCENAENHENDHGRRDQRDRLVKRNSRPSELAPHPQCSFGETAPDRSAWGPGPGGSFCETIC